MTTLIVLHRTVVVMPEGLNCFFHITLTFSIHSLNLTGGFPVSYTVEIKRGLQNWEEEGIISVSNITTLFHDQTGLTPLTIYDARVLSVNFNGLSDFSYFVRFRTVGK